MGRVVRVFLNEKSGAGGADAATITALFAQHGSKCQVSAMRRELDMQRLALDDAEDIDWIAAGGDGTVNAVAQVVQGGPRRMGVLPVGTLNHFAKDAGLPLELERAVAVAAGDRWRAVDAGSVNGAAFVNNSSLGIYPAMVLDRERMKKSGWNKWASLLVASLKAFVRFQCLQVEMEVRGKTQRCKTPFVFVGNNSYCMEGMEAGTRTTLNRGMLAVYVAPGVTRWGMLRMALAALFGRLKRVTEFEEMQVTSFTAGVRGKRRVRVSLDGEVHKMAGPLRYEVRPAALRVLCAETAAKEAQ